MILEGFEDYGSFFQEIKAALITILVLSGITALTGVMISAVLLKSKAFKVVTFADFKPHAWERGRRATGNLANIG